MRRRQCRGDVMALRIEIAERLGGRDTGTHDRTVGQIGIGEGDRARNRVDRGIAGADTLGNGTAASGNRRRIVGAGDDDGDGLERGLVVGREIVVDPRQIGQRQGLVGSQEVEGAIGDVVGPGRRAVVDLVGVLHHGERHFHRLDRRNLRWRQRRGDITVLRVLVFERIERRLRGRLIAGVDVGISDLAGQRILRRTGGEPGTFGEGGIGGDDIRRPRNMLHPFWGRAAVRSPGIVENLGEFQSYGDILPGRRFDEHRLRDDGIGELLVGLRIYQVSELQRKDVGDDLLRIGRQLHGRQEVDGTLAVDDRLRAGLIDGRDRRQRGLVEQDIGAGGAVGFDQHLEFRRRRAALARHHEIDFDQHRGAADAHGRHRSVDLHVAFLGGTAGDKRDRALDQADQR